MCRLARFEFWICHSAFVRDWSMGLSTHRTSWVGIPYRPHTPSTYVSFGHSHDVDRISYVLCSSRAVSCDSHNNCKLCMRSCGDARGISSISMLRAFHLRYSLGTSWWTTFRWVGFMSTFPIQVHSHCFSWGQLFLGSFQGTRKGTHSYVFIEVKGNQPDKGNSYWAFPKTRHSHT